MLTGEQIFYTLSILAIILFMVRCVIRPKNMVNRYTQLFKEKGYRVYSYPFVPLLAPSLLLFQRNEKQKGDAFAHYRNEFHQYDAVISNISRKPIIHLINPELIKDYYIRDQCYDFPKVISYMGIIKKLTGGGIAFDEGKQWHNRRRILNRVFTFDIIKNSTTKIRDICKREILLSEQTARLQVKGDQKLFHYCVFPMATRIFSSVVAECFLGSISNQTVEGERVCQYLVKISDLAGYLARSLPGVMFGANYARLNITKVNRKINHGEEILHHWARSFIKNKLSATEKKYKEIESKGEKMVPQDLIEALYIDQLSHRGQEKEKGYSQNEMAHQFLTFFFAGTDTTSSVFQTMIYMLAQHPEVEVKIRAEVRQFDEQQYTYENLKKLNYIECFQKEVLRMHTPAPGLFPRETARDTYLCGIPIQKQTIILPNVMANQYNPTYYKNPHEFRPERWESECDNIPLYTFNVFSAGGRTCIGKHLAMLESKIALIEFVKRYSSVIMPQKDFKILIRMVSKAEQIETIQVCDQKQIQV